MDKRQIMRELGAAAKGGVRVSAIMFVLEAESEACRFDAQTLIDNAHVFVGWGEHYTGKRGSIVRDNGGLYKALHDVGAGQSAFRPSESPSLWKAIGDPADEWPAWSQPISGVDLPYQPGDKVSHNSKRWTCDEVSNFYEPGVWGWTEVA